MPDRGGVNSAPRTSPTPGTDQEVPAGPLGHQSGAPESPRPLFSQLAAAPPSLQYWVGHKLRIAASQAPVCCQLPRCLRVMKVQEVSRDCVTFQRGVTLQREVGRAASQGV